MSARSKETAKQKVATLALWSIPVALAVLALKFTAWWITGSVALYSDALESIVNVIASFFALWAIRISHLPADENHPFGHHKAEYLSAVVEGALIIVAALLICRESFFALQSPVPLERPWPGMALNAVGGALNAVWAWVLIRVGRQERSPALEADGRHILTDVWTSVGVIVGVSLVGLTGWQRLDPTVAAIVGVNILLTGFRLVSQSMTSLLDAALPAADVERVAAVLEGSRSAEVDFADLRTRESGRHRFVSFTVVVPGAWTVDEGHDLADQVEVAITKALPDTTVHTHIEPRRTS